MRHRDRPDKFTNLNIRLINYQLGWDLEQETSKLMICPNNDLPKTLIEFPHLLNSELIENNINNKINTILSFL